MSIAQPSANQIANIYQGNPGALNARIQQEQKGKPAGLPPDLTKLMALNINVNEQDAAKRQQAMAALQSMQQQSGGELPTVAQTIQQQAAQKAQIMQQQMQQMQPKPQGLMALLQQRGMPQAPENAPRPDRQPSGIDELSSNVGEHFDGGGIVAFDKGGETDKKLKQYTLQQQGADYVARRQAEREAEIARRLEAEESRQALVDQIPSDGQTAPASNRRGEESELDRNIANTLAALPGAGIMRGVTNIRALGPMLASLLNKDKQEVETPAQPRPAMSASEQRAPAMSNRALLNAADADLRGLPAALKKETPPVVNQQPPKPSAPAAPPKPAAPAAPAEKSSREKFFDSMLEKTPDERRDEALRRYKETIGDPDVSAQEKYIKQLEESRARFQEPTDFAGRLSAWARNTANAGGRSSLETGSRGAAASEAERRSMAQKDIEALKELMAESSKVADIKRGYKKEVFAFGEGEYKEAYKNGLEVAKEMGLDKRQQELFAHQSAENALQRANAVKVAGMPTGEERMFGQFARAWLAKEENKGKTMPDAYAAYRMAGAPSAGMKGIMTRDQAEDNFRKDMENFQLASEMKKEAVKYYGKEPTYSEMKEYFVQKQMGVSGKGGASTSTSGKVVDFSSLPK
jgi:hypothetical protein